MPALPGGPHPCPAAAGVNTTIESVTRTNGGWKVVTSSVYPDDEHNPTVNFARQLKPPCSPLGPNPVGPGRLVFITQVSGAAPHNGARVPRAAVGSAGAGLRARVELHPLWGSWSPVGMLCRYACCFEAGMLGPSFRPCCRRGPACAAPAAACRAT